MSQYTPNFDKSKLEVKLSPFEESIYRAMRGEGFLLRDMLTLAGPLGTKGVSKEWLEREFHNCTIFYGKKFCAKAEYRIVCNRGHNGKGEWSAHVVWKNEVPKHVEEMVLWWNKRFGKDRAKLSTHAQSLRYWVKNMGEPDAFTKDGPHNRTLVEPEVTVDPLVWRNQSERND
jgi:hypothetical protein